MERCGTPAEVYQFSGVFRYIEEALQEIPLNAGAHKVGALEGSWASPATPAPPQLTEGDKEKLVPVPNTPKAEDNLRQTSWPRTMLGSFHWQKRTCVSPHPQGILERKPGRLGYLVWLAFCRKKCESHDHTQAYVRDKPLQKMRGSFPVVRQSHWRCKLGTTGVIKR